MKFSSASGRLLVPLVICLLLGINYLLLGNQKTFCSPIVSWGLSNRQKDHKKLFIHPSNGTCEKHDKIYFLKTSKTGGTTISNILMRFGFLREKNYLMGESIASGGMFFENGYMPFTEETCYLGPEVGIE